MGDDNAWLGKAKALAAKEPHRARALHAFLVHHAEDENARATANRLLAESLLKDGHGETLRALYLNSTRIAGPDAVPQGVRYRLAEIALAQHDMKLAAALLKDLTEPPAGEDATIWTLRRARALVYIGDIATAQPLLTGLLERQKTVDAEFARHFLQVVFDLQTLGRHTEALALLEKLSAGGGDKIATARTALLARGFACRAGAECRSRRAVPALGGIQRWQWRRPLGPDRALPCGHGAGARGHDDGCAPHLYRASQIHARSGAPGTDRTPIAAAMAKRPYDAVIAAPFGRLGVTLQDGRLADIDFLASTKPLRAPRTEPRATSAASSMAYLR